MAIAGSGAVSLSDFRSEFVGGSAAISLGDLYRGGSHIRAKAGNNSATNLAASVPTSGTIDFDDFYSTAKGFRYTYTSGATNQDASNLFGSDYGVDYPKEIVINSGVELGATSTSQEALQINSGLSGTMKVTNNGTLSGAGGSANGGAGGDAFEANVSCTLINNGTIRAGGGGGGQGGTGGQGSQSYSSYSSWSSFNGPGGGYETSWRSDGAYQYWYWAGSHVATTGVSTSSTGSNPQYQRQYSYAVPVGPQYPGGGGYVVYVYSIRRRTLNSGTNYYNGGAGGSGGVGQGYGQSAGSGSGGSGGGTNAGSGGSGGGGGSFGNNGSTGNSGGNGNHTNGSGGSGGGSAGRYINGIGNVSLTQNGTVQGGTA